MTAVETLREAARLMQQDRDTRWHAVADWLDSEAVVIEAREPFVELLNATFEHVSGIETALRLGRDENGELAMQFDTSPAALAAARAYLGETS